MRIMMLAAPLSLALFGCGERTPDPRGVGPDEVLLQVAASGRADTRPDEARFTAGVQTIAASAAAASNSNNQKMNQVTAALEQLGIKPDDLQTRQIGMSRIDYGPERGRFQANNMIEVRVRDMAKAGEAIAAATGAGANVLSGPNLAISDPEAANRSAYPQAYKAARARAETYAEAAGLKVARVLVIRDSGDGPPGYYEPPPIVRVEAAAQTVAPPVRAGMTTSEVRVRADFALAPK
jgi:uncharacterized protein YggE